MIFTRKLNTKINSKEQKAISKQAAEPRQDPNTSQEENCGHRTSQRQTEATKENGRMWTFQFFQGINCQKPTWQEPCDYFLSSHTEKSNKKERQCCGGSVIQQWHCTPRWQSHVPVLRLSSWKAAPHSGKHDAPGWCFGPSHAGKHGNSVQHHNDSLFGMFSLQTAAIRNMFASCNCWEHG